MVRSAEEYIDLLKWNLLGLGNEEVNERGETDVDGHKEKHALEPRVVEEQWEELVEDSLRDILSLGAHANCLCANVGTEDLGGPDPGGGAPRGLVEEDEEEQQEDDGDADRLRLGRCTRGSEPNHTDAHHTQAHADRANDEHPASSESVNSPCRVQREEDAEGGIERVDEVDRTLGCPHLLVDLGRVCVERALAGKLLANVENESQVESLPN